MNKKDILLFIGNRIFVEKYPVGNTYYTVGIILFWKINNLIKLIYVF